MLGPGRELVCPRLVLQGEDLLLHSFECHVLSGARLAFCPDGGEKLPGGKGKRESLTSRDTPDPQEQIRCP